MLKGIEVIDADKANRLVAQKVLGWVLNESGSFWCKRDAQSRTYKPFRRVEDWEPVNVELHALHLTEFLSQQSTDWYIQVELQGGVYRVFVEHEGTRKNGYGKHHYFTNAVVIAVLLAHGVPPQEIELKPEGIDVDCTTTSNTDNQQLSGNLASIDPAIQPDNPDSGS